MRNVRHKGSITTTTFDPRTFETPEPIDVMPNAIVERVRKLQELERQHTRHELAEKLDQKAD